MKYRIPRGTQDILPDVSGKWQRMEEVSRRVMSRYGFSEIRTPVFEQEELFLRTVGETSDIVSKEMYVLEDRKGRRLALRPEGTAPVIRSYIENSMYKERALTRLYYIGPMFRYDRPQKGRYRQFHQIGAEAVGSISPLVDAETIAMVWRMLAELGLKNIALKINTLGDNEGRPKYIAAIQEYYRGKEDNLCTDCRVRLEKNPLRLLDCKVPSCREMVDGIPVIEDYLTGDAAKHYGEVLEWLEKFGVPYEKDKNLVRGLDYYTRTTFEFHHTGLGASVAVGGGGRYDNLVSECGGPDMPGIGFSLGCERLLLAIDTDKEAAGESESAERTPGLYLAWIGEEAFAPSFRLAEKLRSRVRVEIDIENKSMKAQLRQADRLNLSHALVIGENELKEGCYQVKNLSTGDQVGVKAENIEIYIYSQIN